MHGLLNLWKNVSIAKKLYFVVGIMALLIGGELVTLRFAMRKLSAGRAFVGAESMWSKAQKDAVFSLQRFGITKKEEDYAAFLAFLKVNEGDHRARLALEQKNPDMSIVRQGFLDGHVHEEDIEPIVELIRGFYWISYLARAIEIWRQGDVLLFQLEDAGHAYHDAILAEHPAKAAAVLNDVKRINEELTVLEENFSAVLGQGSRWLENMVLSLLTIAVLTVESVGLTLAMFTSRAISLGLTELNEAASRIGRGDFSQEIQIRSLDEIGRLGIAVNSMGKMLNTSYSELEQRVQERTADLGKMAAENAKLYEEAKAAVQIREEFLSIASHELKTPLTSLYLQLQILARGTRDLPAGPGTTKFVAMIDSSLKSARAITALLNGLLDLTRLRVGKFELHRQHCDLIAVVNDVVGQLATDAARAGSTVQVRSEGSVVGNFDIMRMGQVITNLLSNAIKYGCGKPIEISLRADGNQAVICVVDGGGGIVPEQQSLIFERFERAQTDTGISGLGLGLYIAQQIVKAHGGMISVESSVGKGSVFTVRV